MYAFNASVTEKSVAYNVETLVHLVVFIEKQTAEALFT